jgi:hypothetical protein
MIRRYLRRGKVQPKASLGVSTRELVWAFGSRRPSLARFPHCVFRNTDESFNVVRQTVGVPLGIWNVLPPFGDTPPIDPQGDHRRVSFAMWAEKSNQECLLRSRTIHNELCLITAADAPPQALQKIDEHPVHDYYSYLEHLPLWLPELGWAWVGLEVEFEFALLVASHEKRDWLTQIHAALEAAGADPFQVELRSRKWIWNWKGPPEDWN